MGLKNALLARYIFEYFRVPGLEGLLMDQIDYLWNAAYMAAVYETDDSLLPGRILEALAAIEQRLLAPSEIDTEELTAIRNAQDGLQSLKAERVAKMHCSDHEPDLDSSTPSQSSLPT
jgi:hypothetical protein